MSNNAHSCECKSHLSQIVDNSIYFFESTTCSFSYSFAISENDAWPTPINTSYWLQSIARRKVRQRLFGMVCVQHQSWITLFLNYQFKILTVFFLLKLPSNKSMQVESAHVYVRFRTHHTHTFVVKYRILVLISCLSLRILFSCHMPLFVKNVVIW